MSAVIMLLPLLAQLASFDERSLREWLQEVDRSGRVLTLTQTLDESLRIAPGSPPVLAFRYFEGQERGRFGGLDLVLDDAGH